jgi:hypothetical protein
MTRRHPTIPMVFRKCADHPDPCVKLLSDSVYQDCRRRRGPTTSSDPGRRRPRDHQRTRAEGDRRLYQHLRQQPPPTDLG